MIYERIRGLHAVAVDHLLEDFHRGSVLLAEYAIVEEWTLHDGKCTVVTCPEGRVRKSTDAGRFRFDWPAGVPVYLAVRSRALVRDRRGSVKEVFRFRSSSCGTFTKGSDGRWKIVKQNDHYDTDFLETYWLMGTTMDLWIDTMSDPNRRPR
jgi:hypothetical protein